MPPSSYDGTALTCKYHYEGLTAVSSQERASELTPTPIRLFPSYTGVRQTISNMRNYSHLSSRDTSNYSRHTSNYLT